jgi:hypothetical protein
MVMRAVGLVDQETEATGVWNKRSLLWALRVLTGGLGFLAAALLVGRAAEKIATGTGAATATAFGLGTVIVCATALASSVNREIGPLLSAEARDVGTGQRTSKVPQPCS